MDLTDLESASGEFSVRYSRGVHKDRPLISEIRWNGEEREIPMSLREARSYRDLAERRGLRVKIVRI